MKKILITGGNGFIGRNLVEFLKEKYIIIYPSSRELDLLDEKQVLNYIKEQSFDVIIHTAKKDGVKGKISDYNILDSNLRMFFNLTKYSSYYGKLIYFGSGAEYHKECMHPFVSEGLLGKCIPSDPYGFSKYIMADKTENADNIYELCLFGIFGKYEAWQRRFISNAICRSLYDLPITIQQNVYFDYLYIGDLCKIMPFFIEDEPRHKRYNMCRGEHVDLYTLAKIVKKITGNPYEIQVAEKGLKPEYSGNNERMMTEFPQISFISYEEAIAELTKYYKAHLYEIDKDLLL